MMKTGMYLRRIDTLTLQKGRIYVGQGLVAAISLWTLSFSTTRNHIRPALVVNQLLPRPDEHEQEYEHRSSLRFPFFLSLSFLAFLCLCLYLGSWDGMTPMASVRKFASTLGVGEEEERVFVVACPRRLADVTVLREVA